MKKLSELSLTDLAVLKQELKDQIDVVLDDFNHDKISDINDNINLVQKEINRRLGEIDFNS